MGGFDLVSRVFGIVLALAVSELLKGFARLWRIHHGVEDVTGPKIRIGWLVPMLGILMLLDQVTFWFNFTRIGPHLPATIPGLAGFIAVVGSYFALATFVFPADVKQWPDFDSYYFKIRRVVIGGLLAVNFVGLCYEIGLFLMGIDVDPDPEETGLVSIAFALGALAMMIALLVTRGRRTHLALLGAALVFTLLSEVPF